MFDKIWNCQTWYFFNNKMFIFLLSVFLILMMIILMARLYFRFTNGICLMAKDMTNKVILITGGNTGIGKEYVRDMAKRNATIIMACRNVAKGEQSRHEIVAETSNENIYVEKLDLASLEIVNNFCLKIKQKHKSIDILVCFAAAVGARTEFTEDGFETQFHCNYLSHFLIILQLFPLLMLSTQPKIILTASSGHLLGNIDIANISRLSNYRKSAFRLYCDSKLCFVLLAKELSERFAQTKLVANSFHPGTVLTDGIKNNRIWYIRYFLSFLAFIYGKTEKDGAQTMIYLSVAPEADHLNGQYLADCRPSKANPLINDRVVRNELWNLSYNLVHSFFQHEPLDPRLQKLI